MSYRIAGIDVHKKMLAVVVSDVEIEQEYQFERRLFGSSPEQLRLLAAWLLAQEAEEVGTIGRSPSLTASGTPCRNCPAGNTTLLVRFAFVRSFAFLVLLFVQRGAVHEKQMPFMAGEGACPSAPSSPRVRRSSERNAEA